MTVDTSILTAIANDYGYDAVFRRQVEGLGQPGDVLVGISTSGNSRNVIAAIDEARKKACISLALPEKAAEKWLHYVMFVWLYHQR